MRFVRFVRFVFSKRRFRFPSEALRVLGSSQGPPSRFSSLSLRGRIRKDRASELEGRSVGENILPSDTLRLGAQSLVARAFRLRLRTPTSRKVPTVSGFGRVHRFRRLRASDGTRSGSDGRAFREAASFFLLFSHFVGPDRGARRIVRKAGAAAPVEQLVQLVRLVPLETPRPSSQRLHIPATIAMLVALSSPSFISSPGAFRLGPFASGFSSSTSTRFSSGIAPERPIPLSDTMPTRCRPSGLSGRACRGGGR